MATPTISRRFFNTNSDLTDPVQRKKWMQDLSLMLDDIVGALNSLNAGPTTQSDVTASRTFGTVYQNTSGNPLFVSVSCTQSASGSDTIAAYVDSNSSPSTLICNFNINPPARGILFFIVLSNYYYKVTHTYSTLTSWIEWN